MDIQKIKELALANGFKLKEQADGSMDLNAYVYDFANSIEQAAKVESHKQAALYQFEINHFAKAQAVPEVLKKFCNEHKDPAWRGRLTEYDKGYSDCCIAVLEMIEAQDQLMTDKCAESKQAEIDDLKAQLKAAHESRADFVEYCRMIESGNFVIVDKKDTEDWYLDDSESLWMVEPDNWLSDLYIGEVQSVEHKEYLITESDTLYAAKVWDDANDQVGDWEFFKTEEEAVKAALYCKAKFNDEGE